MQPLTSTTCNRSHSSSREHLFSETDSHLSAYPCTNRGAQVLAGGYYAEMTRPGRIPSAHLDTRLDRYADNPAAGELGNTL
jgi:hypothetical protein